MAKLHKKVIASLRARLGEVEDALDDLPGGYVMGVVISPVFNGKDHQARQKRLWSALKKDLTEEELESVGPIAALTPAEATVKIE